MKRIQLFELEDFEWFPKSLRSAMTNLIKVLLKMMGTKAVLESMIVKTRSNYSFERIVDLGSGSGGAMPDAVASYNTHHTDSPLQLVLTDLHPNPAITNLYNTKGHFITYKEESVDAISLSTAPEGLKTMVNSFHHMPPDKAKAILKSANENRQALLIYELAENKMPLLIWWLLLPISLCILIVMTLFMTPFVKPLSWKQLVFTYIIPIIPICYAWDGQASYPRTYAFKDIELMLADIRTDDFIWEIAPAKNAKGKNAGYYILGYPVIS